MNRVVAILETMWDWRSQASEAGHRQAPRYFRINPKNYTGGRLYKLVGPQARLLVTNACRDLVSHAKQHGKPDPVWLGENLRVLDGVLDDPDDGVPLEGRIGVLLVCGKVAQQAYKDCDFTPRAGTVIEIPHPAARGYWKKEVIQQTASHIQGAL